MSMIKQVVLKVEGMSCGHCKMTVEKALVATQGVRDAVVDLNAKTVKVTYVDDKTNLENMEKAIVDAGYEVVK
jgi:copper chaperone